MGLIGYGYKNLPQMVFLSFSRQMPGQKVSSKYVCRASIASIHILRIIYYLKECDVVSFVMFTDVSEEHDFSISISEK
jgi:hypothetical protein